MKYDQLVKHFGGAAQIARALGYSTTAIYKWRDRGRIPLRIQPFIAFVSNGKLKADKK